MANVLNRVGEIGSLLSRNVRRSHENNHTAKFTYSFTSQYIFSGYMSILFNED